MSGAAGVLLPVLAGLASAVPERGGRRQSTAETRDQKSEQNGCD